MNIRSVDGVETFYAEVTIPVLATKLCSSLYDNVRQAKEKWDKNEKPYICSFSIVYFIS